MRAAWGFEGWPAVALQRPQWQSRACMVLEHSQSPQYSQGDKIPLCPCRACLAGPEGRATEKSRPGGGARASTVQQQTVYSKTIKAPGHRLLMGTAAMFLAHEAEQRRGGRRRAGGRPACLIGLHGQERVKLHLGLPGSEHPPLQAQLARSLLQKGRGSSGRRELRLRRWRFEQT